MNPSTDAARSRDPVDPLPRASPELGNDHAWCRVPQPLLLAAARLRCPAGAKDVLLALLFKQYQWHRDDGKPQALSCRDLEAITGLGRSTVIRAYRWLERTNVIEVRRRGSGGGAHKKSSIAATSPERWPRGVTADTTSRPKEAAARILRLKQRSVTADTLPGVTDDTTSRDVSRKQYHPDNKGRLPRPHVGVVQAERERER